MSGSMWCLMEVEVSRPKGHFDFTLHFNLLSRQSQALTYEDEESHGSASGTSFLFSLILVVFILTRSENRMTHYHVFLPPRELTPLSRFAESATNAEQYSLLTLELRELIPPPGSDSLRNGSIASLDLSTRPAVQSLAKVHASVGAIPVPIPRPTSDDMIWQGEKGLDTQQGLTVDETQVVPIGDAGQLKKLAYPSDDAPADEHERANTQQHRNLLNNYETSEQETTRKSERTIEEIQGLKRARGALRKTQSDVSEGSRRKSTRLSRGGGGECSFGLERLLYGLGLGLSLRQGAVGSGARERSGVSRSWACFHPGPVEEIRMG
jgi:hypothetical protein